MNPSQLIAWFVCLALALFACILAVRNSYKTAVLERQFVQVTETASEETELLTEVIETLADIRELLKERKEQAPARGAEPTPAGHAR